MTTMIEDITSEETLSDAIAAELPVEFRYLPATGQEDVANQSVRLVSPYEFKDGRDGKTLLVCWSHDAEGIRTFDTARMVEVMIDAGEEFVPSTEA